MLQKITVATATVLTLVSNAMAHTGEDSGTASGWMMDGTWMHDAGHMTGYNMWGMGWYGALFGIAIWALVILGIIYFFQQITENGGEQQNER